MKDKIDSTLKLIDESNKSFILHPSSFILTDEGNKSFIFHPLSFILTDEGNQSFILHPLSFILKVLCKSSHFVWNSKINRIIRTIFRTNKTIFLPLPFFSRGSERGSVRCTPPVRVRRRPRLLRLH